MARAVAAQVADGGPRLCGEVIRPRPSAACHRRAARIKSL